MAPTKRVLVVDDDPHIRQLLCDQWSRTYTVETAANGSQAFGAILRTDVGLPGVDGVGVLKALRELAPAIPIVIITGRERAAAADEAARYGAAGWVFNSVCQRWWPGVPPIVGLLDPARSADGHLTERLFARSIRRIERLGAARRALWADSPTYSCAG